MSERAEAIMVDVLAFMLVACGTTDLSGRPDASHDPTAEDDAVEDVPSGDTTGTEPACADHDGDGHLDEACGGDDCDDDDPATYPGAPEVCMDGVDQDCDGMRDEPVLMMEDVVVADGEALGSYPQPRVDMEWTGSEFGIVWEGVYLARVDPSGREIGTGTIVASGDVAELAWTGSEYAIASSPLVGGGFRLTRVDPLSPETWGNSFPFFGSVMMQDLAWMDGVLGLAYRLDWDVGYSPPVGYSNVYLEILTTDGDSVGDRIDLTSYWHASVAQISSQWTGSELGLAFVMSVTRVVFTAYDASGAPTVPLVDLVSDADSSRSPPSLAWTGSRYLVSWVGYLEDPVGLHVLMLSTIPPTPAWELVLDGGEDRYPAMPILEWSGSEIGLSWIEHDGSSWRYLFTRISPGGEEVGRRLDIGEVSCLYCVPFPDYDDHGMINMQRTHAIQWTGSEYGVAWLDEGDGAPVLLFNRVGMCE